MAQMEQRSAGGLRYALHFIALAFFVYAFLLCIKPLSDPDLWWHLKTGEWIVQNHSLPSEDPFSYTLTGPLSGRAELIMKNEWLGEVLFYLAYMVGGYPGISVFRSLLIVIPFFAIYIICVRKGTNPLSALFALSLPLIITVLTQSNTYERPQAFSFILALCLIGILSRLKSAENRLPWSIVLVMTVAAWANLHGGFILGVVIIMAFGLGVTVEAIIEKRKNDFVLLVPLAAGVLASLMNPNTYELLKRFLYSFVVSFTGLGSTVDSDLNALIVEYMPLWNVYREFHHLDPLFILAFMAVTVLTVLVKYIAVRKVDVPELMVFLVLVLFGVNYSRGAPFTLLAFPWFVLSGAGALRKPWRLVSPFAVFVLGIVFVAVMAGRVPSAFRPSPPTTWVDTMYPEEAVEFIKENGISGKMFNEYVWGGYLIWRLHPDYKVFVDGRTLDAETVKRYREVTGAGETWRASLDDYGVNFILVRIVRQDSASVSPLVMKLMEEDSKGWRLVYFGENVALFLRDAPENGDIITRYGFPSRILYGKIYDLSWRVLSTRPRHPNALFSMAVALYGLENYDEAERILRSLPPSPLREEYLRRIKGKSRRGL